MADNPFLQTVQDVHTNRAALQLVQAHTQSEPGLTKSAAAYTAALSRTTGQSMEDISYQANKSFEMAAKHGLDTSFGLRAAQSSTTFTYAYGKQNLPGSFGGLSAERAGKLDQELRLAAAKSPMANALGAAHAMAESGVINEDQLKKLISTESLAQGPAGMMSQLKKMGVNVNVAGQFMSATHANQEQIAKHGLQDKVRQMQRDEIGGLIQQQLAGDLMGHFRQKGMDRDQARAATNKSSISMQQELMKIAQKNPELLNNQAELAKQLAASAGVDTATAAGAIRGLQERVMSDPNLNKFGNLQGLLNMQRREVDKDGKEGDLIGTKEMKAAREASPKLQEQLQKAESDRTAKMSELRKELGIEEGISGEALKNTLKRIERDKKSGPKQFEMAAQLQKLDEAGNVQRGPATNSTAGRETNGARASGPMHITGELTLLDGGRGNLDGQASGGAPSV